MTNKDKIDEIRRIVEQHENNQQGWPIKFESFDDGVRYMATTANTMAINVARLLLSELDRVNEALQSAQQDKERLIEGLKQFHKESSTWNGYRIDERIEKLLKDVGVTI